MRSKEDAHDYRYFPDPDLLPLEIRPEWIAEVGAGLPELPQAMQQRLQSEYGLSAYDAAILTGSRGMADFFSIAVGQTGAAGAKLVANWVMGELAARLNREELEIADAPLSPAQLAGLITRIADNTISNNIAKKVFEALWNREGSSADEIIEKQGLKQITDIGAIEALVDGVLAANQKSVEEFRAGKEKAFNALVGQAMKATKGQANPQQVTDLLKKKLGG
jgi:aspartyl-tRNA(Asn)/glutamyl-tRNA(Gln) amidotransferase subunit B